MAIRLDFRDGDFETRFAAFLTTKREVSEDVNATVRAIIDEVRENGDRALAAYTLRFDGLDFGTVPMRVGADEIEAAYRETPAEVVAALELAARRIEKHHARQLPKDDLYEDDIGVGLGSRWTAIDAVGLYVPGGTTMTMRGTPATLAGTAFISTELG